MKIYSSLKVVLGQYSQESKAYRKEYHKTRENKAILGRKYDKGDINIMSEKISEKN